METIYAPATARGRAGIAVIRVSGAEALELVGRLAGDLPVSGRTLRRLKDGTGATIDEALILTFAEGASFTGEAVVEIHLHGSVAVVDAVLRELADGHGSRPAEAGEFTRRALENGRLDLARVEGLADLIDAETEAQRKQAVRVFSGEFSEMVDGWRASLLRATALVEATIDFADEDVPVDVYPEVRELVEKVGGELNRQIEGVRMAERIRDGFEVAIVGAPNVGKSTLLNRLAGRDAALTSAVAGTTRDVIEVRMVLGGLPVTVLDTAGLRESTDEIERLGIARGRDRADRADLRVHLVEEGGRALADAGPADIFVVAKDDTGTAGVPSISGKTGQGLDALVAEIEGRLSVQAVLAGTAMRERHRIAMAEGRRSLALVLDDLGDMGVTADIIAELLRQAIRSLDELVGRVDVEDVLGEVFSSFCIGK